MRMFLPPESDVSGSSTDLLLVLVNLLGQLAEAVAVIYPLAVNQWPLRIPWLWQFRSMDQYIQV